MADISTPPIGTGDPDVFDYNVQRLDEAVNSNADYWTSRKGQKKLTWEGLTRLSDPGAAAAAAERAEAAAEFVEQAAGMYTYLTKADADAAMPLPDGTYIRVTNDPDPANNGNWVSDGTDLVWSGLQPISQEHFDEKLNEIEHEITNLEETKLPGLIVDSEEFVGGIIADDGYIPLGVTRPGGHVRIGQIRIETHDMTDFYPRLVGMIVSENGFVLQGFDPVTGESVISPGPGPDPESKSPGLSAYDELFPSASINGLTVDLSGSYIIRANERINIAGSVTLPPTSIPPRRTLSDRTLTYNSVNYLSDGTDSMGRVRMTRNVSNVVVIRVSDGVELQPSIDYTLSAEGDVGKITGSNPDVPSVAVDISFDFRPERYDVIQIHPETLEISVVSGVERNIDAHEPIYRGQPTGGAVPIYYAYVYGSQVGLVDASAWREGFPGRQFVAQLSQIQSHNRRCLSRIIGKLTRGEPVTLAGYGDSITALGGSTAFTANGTGRDNMGYALHYPHDTREALGLFDFDDGGGLVHFKWGWNWVLKQRLEDQFGATVAYSNYGISGTTSSASTNNGLFPARIAQILDDAPDLTVVAFGMNELGSENTYVNVRSIVEQLRSVGSDVIVMGVPRRAERMGSLDGWRYTNRALRRAALDAGAAFVPMLYVADDDAIGYLGVHPRSLCATNASNHPGYQELQQIGHALATLF